MKYIRKSKVMEYLNIGESALKQLVYSKKLIPYHKQGTEAFFQLKQVYKLIEDRKSDIDFVKEMPMSKEQRELKHHQEKFYYYTIMDVLEGTIGKSKVFQSDKRNEIVEAVIKNNGDFTFVAKMYGFKRTCILTIFRQAMSIHMSRFRKVSEAIELESKHIKLLEDYQKLIEMNKQLVLDIENLTSIKRMDAESNLNIMSIKISDLPLSVRAYNCLHAAKVKNLYDISQISIQELSRYRNVGLKTVVEIEEVAKDYGVTLKQIPSPL